MLSGFHSSASRHGKRDCVHHEPQIGLPLRRRAAEREVVALQREFEHLCGLHIGAHPQHGAGQVKLSSSASALSYAVFAWS